MIGDDIEDFLAALTLERSLSGNTVVAYGNDLRRFAAQLKKSAAKTQSGEVTREDIVAFLGEERTAGRSATTRARRTAAIRAFFKFLKERRVVKHDPSELLDSPKKPLRLPKVLSEAEVTAILEAVGGTDPRDLRDRALLETLYGCGLRVSEACEMKMEDIVAEGELVRIVGKGSKERVVPLGRAAGAALVAYFDSGRGSFCRDSAERHVFLTRLGRPFTRQGIFKVVRERAMAAGIAAERISPHVMRHCFASHLLAHGADIRSIQEMLGHADVGTTQIYTHVDTERIGEIHRKYHPRA